MRIAHLTTVDLSLRYLILPQLEAAAAVGESFGISAPGPYVTEIEERGIRHIPLHSSTRGVNVIGDLRAMRQFWKALKTIQPDIVHTHNPKPGAYGRVLSRLAGVPIVVNTVHGFYATENDRLLKRLLVYGLESVASLFSDIELVQSAEDVATMRRWRIGRRSRTVHLGNGVDLHRFENSDPACTRKEARRKLGFDPDAVIVGCVARLVEEKGVIDLIEAWKARTIEYTLMVAGSRDPTKADALDPELIRQAEHEGVLFLGHREDVDKLYKAWDVFVLASYREGFPRSAMEAAASSLPVIATDIRGCREVVEDDWNGLLVPPGSPLRLAEAIDALVRDPRRRTEMGAFGAEKAASDFDEARVVEKVLAAYREVARRKHLNELASALSAAEFPV